MKALSRMCSRSAKRRGIESVAMTPMIDVVFQMLIYFVLTFQLPDRLSAMPVTRPRGDGVAGNIGFSVQVEKEGVRMEGRRVTLAELERIYNRFADLDPERNMIVVSTAESPHHRLVAVLNLLNKAGLDNISLLSSK